ncbi:MAG: hypothetical protein K0U84_14095 [Actinomycetia bacterium]|nr:hypothetical protein [Actinomycetes bacterium]
MSRTSSSRRTPETLLYFASFALLFIGCGAGTFNTGDPIDDDSAGDQVDDDAGDDDQADDDAGDDDQADDDAGDDDQADDDAGDDDAGDDDDAHPCQDFDGSYQGTLSLTIDYNGQTPQTYPLQLNLQVQLCQARGTVAGGLEITEFFGLVHPSNGTAEGVIAGDLADAGEMVILWDAAAVYGDTFTGQIPRTQGWGSYWAQGEWTVYESKTTR